MENHCGRKKRVEDEMYNVGESVILRQPKGRIEVLDMQYLVRFEIDSPQSEHDYVQQRNEMLRNEEIAIPITDLSGIPIQVTLSLTRSCFARVSAVVLLAVSMKDLIQEAGSCEWRNAFY